MALASLLVVSPAFAQAPEFWEDEDLLTPRERTLARHPNLHQEWTWMREGQAVSILNAAGYFNVLSLERYGAFWRGKAAKDDGSYHVAINRYAEIISHIDRKSLIVAMERNERANPAAKNLLATLNGPIEVPKSQAAPTGLTRRPVASVMGEVGWTWMREDQVARILESKGYARISNLQRDVEGIWRAEAINSELAAVRIGVDVFGNVEARPVGQGGLAQGSLPY